MMMCEIGTDRRVSATHSPRSLPSVYLPLLRLFQYLQRAPAVELSLSKRGTHASEALAGQDGCRCSRTVSLRHYSHQMRSAAARFARSIGGILAS